MKASITKTYAVHPRSPLRPPATSSIVTTPSAIDHPSCLFEHLLDAG
ncbi:MAG: hypothetical protein V2I56_13315 [Desulfobacteraceae bacterium]|nr:hypothetical protein [Desulfobacteraceae bacterium]